MDSSLKSLAVRVLPYLPRPLQNTIDGAKYLKKRTRGGPPKFFKYWLFDRYLGEADYVYESGTFLGDSTAYLAKGGRPVDSVEPGKALCERARKRFRGDDHIRILEGSSEDLIASTLRDAREKGYRRIGFWLDGHNSDNDTAVDVGDAPVIHELAAIFAERDAFETITILIDDARYMAEIADRDLTYPPLRTVIESLYGHGFDVYIEHNVLIGRYAR